MKVRNISISRLHEIRCGNPSSREENIEMAKTLININNSYEETIAYLIQCENGHQYTTTRGNVASWERQKGSVVTELTYK